jgi:hypothetical protein
MHLYCQNHAGRCPKVPGKVCTVVPASGSRSSIGDRVIARHRNERPPPHELTPRSESELGPGGRLLESRPAGWCETPVIAVGLERFWPNCDGPNCYLYWHVTESGAPRRGSPAAPPHR